MGLLDGTLEQKIKRLEKLTSPNQYGKGIMLGTSLIGRDGAGLGHPSLYRSHYNDYPQQKYNI